MKKRILTLFCAMLFMAGCTMTVPRPTDTPAPSHEHEDFIPSLPPEDPMPSPVQTSQTATAPSEKTSSEMDAALADLPPFAGEAAVPLNANEPFFSENDLKLAQEGNPFEYYCELDTLGRCGETYANVCKETMPIEERGNIGMIRPSGWKTTNYHELVDGNYLYNRCHLIGFQLTGENANVQNLITGTRYMNTQGMLPYENEVATYVERTTNHVLYRVTPIFAGDNLVASGVVMEAMSVEDNGEGVEFCVYCYNVQPGIIIDYATGDSEVDKTYVPPPETPIGEVTYILNTRSKKFHRPDCSGAKTIADHNRSETDKSRDALVADGYSACGSCKP